MEGYKFTSGLDRIGIATSTLCAVHCLLVPLTATMLPFWGLTFLANPWIDMTMIGAGLLIGGVSLGRSYFRQHRRLFPSLLFLAGFGLIIIIHLLHAHPVPLPDEHGHSHRHGIQEIILLFLGGIGIAAAHFLNWRYARRECAFRQEDGRPPRSNRPG